MLKVDKGIPVPKNHTRGDAKYPFAEMEPGDSFAVPGYSKEIRNRISAAMNSYLKRNDLKDTKRFKVGKHTNPSGALETRCWRIK